MSSGLCDCFLLRRHGAATTATGATAATSRGPSGGRESKAHSQEALMSQDLVYREISVNSLSDHLAEPASEPKQELFVPDFTPFQTSSLLIESSHSSKTLEKSNEKKKNTNIAKEMKTRLSFLLQRPDSSSGDQNMESENSLEVPERSGRPTPHEAQEWGRSLEALLSHHNGIQAFRSFLRSEFSEENIEFWVACQDYRATKSAAKVVPKARKIYSEYISIQAPKEINLDSQTREAITHSLAHPTMCCFNAAQRRVYSLMEKDSYPRFLKSQMYQDLIGSGQR
ncbi:regulator of G-protein signaling 8-like isoform X1 [Erpetoichthys calabaricus]|nr:regulator of G-protein signaling 8-like isoform X1 [Erpetoichthys calabaricus]